LQKIDHNIGLRHFFRRKLAKIAENCDHNIDPWFLILLGIVFCRIKGRATQTAWHNRGQYYDFVNIFAQRMAKLLSIFIQNTYSKIQKSFRIHFFAEKWAKKQIMVC
jgi:hypothetical protein